MASVSLCAFTNGAYVHASYNNMAEMCQAHGKYGGGKYGGGCGGGCDGGCGGGCGGGLAVPKTLWLPSCLSTRLWSFVS